MHLPSSYDKPAKKHLVLLILAHHGCYVPELAVHDEIHVRQSEDLMGKNMLGSQEASRHQKKLYYEFLKLIEVKKIIFTAFISQR